jgi:hypothetical protein
LATPACGLIQAEKVAKLASQGNQGIDPVNFGFLGTEGSKGLLLWATPTRDGNAQLKGITLEVFCFFYDILLMNDLYLRKIEYFTGFTRNIPKLNV